jgi:hypothetical protein
VVFIKFHGGCSSGKGQESESEAMLCVSNEDQMKGDGGAHVPYILPP